MTFPLFADPEWLLAGLAALVLLVLLFFLSERHASRRLQRFAAPGLVERLTGSYSRRRFWTKNVLLAVAVLLAFISLARPQWGANWEKAETRGIDIMIALDTSRSMLAEDISPNRLDRAKLAILDLLELVRGDRVGLIAFAGNAFLQCPLTLDYQAFRQTLAAVNTESIPVGGTDLAAAIDEAEAYFENTANERILILITDGEDLEASGLRKADEAARKGTRILTVGVGSPEGELIPITSPNGQRDYLRDSSGKPVTTALDESTLRRIATATGGVYAPLGPTGSGLERVYQFSLSQMPARERQESLQRIPIERYQWPLLLAVLFLLVESVLTTRARSLLSSNARIVTGALILLSVLNPRPLEAGPAGDAAKAYKEERFEESADLYRQALENEPDDADLHYNLGVSAYRAGQYEDAIAAFERTLKLAKPKLQTKAFYNTGNGRVAYGHSRLEDEPTLTRDLWQAALSDYQNALDLDANHQPSQQNLAKLEETIANYTHDLTTAADPPMGGSVSPGSPVFHRVPTPLEAEPAENWLFTGWTGEGIEHPDQAKTIVRLERDTHVTASFVRTWQLEVRSADPDMGSAGKSGRYREDEPVPVKAEAKDYFAFSKWSSESCEIADPFQPETEVTLDRDAVVTAHFVPAFKLTTRIDPEIGGQAGPSGFFEEYSTVDIQAKPRPGFEWTGWIGDGIKEPDQEQSSITMTGDRVAVAVMDRVWNLVIVPLPEEGGSVEGAGDHPVGSTVDISATPAEGFTFEGWDGPGVSDPASPETSVTVASSEHTLYARFRKDDQQDENEDQQNQDQQQQQDQDSEGGEGQEPQEDQQENQEQQPEEEDSQPESEDPQQEAGDQEQPEQQQSQGSSEEQEQEAANPVEMTPEEARQLLNALSENERFLPAGELSREKTRQEPGSTGRNW